MKMRIMIFVLLCSFFDMSCAKRSYTNSVPAASQGASVASPSLIIYKTRSDYQNFVPVILTPDRSAIASYPGVKDIYYWNKLSYPTPLSGGFLMDNRGIGPNVAFLNITYEEYAGYHQTPAVEELWKRILDKEPLLEMYDCGQRAAYTDPEREINAVIESGDLSKFRKLR